MQRRLIVAVAAIAALLLPGRAGVRAATPISQFHLDARGVVTTAVRFRAGATYPMVISGQRAKHRTYDNKLHTVVEDAFYCFGSPDMPPSECNLVSGASGVSITARTGETTTQHPLQEFLPDGEVIPNGPPNTVWRRPPFQESHVYMFNYRPKLAGQLVLATSETCTTECDGEGFEVQIFPALGDPDPCDPSPVAPIGGRARAVNEVRVVGVQPGVEVHRAGAPEDTWCPVMNDMVLQQGDEISCDPDGAVTIQFADNSTVVVKNTTQLKIASFFTEGGVVKTEILLKMGEVAAQVHKSKATPSDFRIKSPTATVSVRGTDFSVFYDPGSGATLCTVREGTVALTNTTGGEQMVGAGNEAVVSSAGKFRLGAAGKAGARGGSTLAAAVAKVLAVIAQADACKVSTPRNDAYTVKPVPGAWSVAVTLTGDHAGVSKWKVKGSRVKAANALAKQIAKHCP